jgi:hypothetical protein
MESGNALKDPPVAATNPSIRKVAFMLNAKTRTAARMAALTVLCLLPACATTPQPPEMPVQPVLAQLTNHI